MYTTPQARVVDDSTVIGEVDMSHTQRVSGVQMGVLCTAGSGKSRAM